MKDGCFYDRYLNYINQNATNVTGTFQKKKIQNINMKNTGNYCKYQKLIDNSSHLLNNSFQAMNKPITKKNRTIKSNTFRDYGLIFAITLVY